MTLEQISSLKQFVYRLRKQLDLLHQLLDVYEADELLEARDPDLELEAAREAQAIESGARNE